VRWDRDIEKLSLACSQHNTSPQDLVHPLDVASYHDLSRSIDVPHKYRMSFTTDGLDQSTDLSLT
jgi:hypothetical protein